MEPIAEGNTADIFLSQGKIIKLFKGFRLPAAFSAVGPPDLKQDGHNEAEYEANKQIFAYSLGLPVPRVYEVSVINGRLAIIMEYIAGPTLGRLIFDDAAQTEFYMNLSVNAQIKIHNTAADGLERMPDKLNRQLRTASLLSEKQKNVLIERLNAIKYNSGLCHGDFHVFNLILNESGVTVIDWVDSSSGDRRADVYRTFLLYIQYSKELAHLYLKQYCAKSGLTPEEIFIWEPIIAGARLSENVSTENNQRLLEIVRKYVPD